MAANIAGNQKTKQKHLIKFGGCEEYDRCIDCSQAMRAYRLYMAELGAKGGKARVKKGVAVWRWGGTNVA